jgi:hypothetical protein
MQIAILLKLPDSCCHPCESRCGNDRLCYVIITERRVAASKPVLSEVEGPQALGMVANKKKRFDI